MNVKRSTADTKKEDLSSHFVASSDDCHSRQSVSTSKVMFNMGPTSTYMNSRGTEVASINIRRGDSYVHDAGFGSQLFYLSDYSENY